MAETFEEKRKKWIEERKKQLGASSAETAPASSPAATAGSDSVTYGSKKKTSTYSSDSFAEYRKKYFEDMKTAGEYGLSPYSGTEKNPYPKSGNNQYTEQDALDFLDSFSTSPFVTAVSGDKGGYRDSSYYDNLLGSMDSLYENLYRASGYFYNNRNNYDDEDLKELGSSLSGIEDYLNSTKDALTKNKNTYGGFANKDEYDAAVKAYDDNKAALAAEEKKQDAAEKEKERLSSLNLGEAADNRSGLSSRLKTAEDTRNRAYKELMAYQQQKYGKSQERSLRLRQVYNDAQAEYEKIKTEISSANTEYTTANLYQKQEYYSAIPEAPDYEQYSLRRYDVDTGVTAGASVYAYINDIDGYRTRNDVLSRKKDSGNLAIYDNMTSDEIGIYNYLYSKEGGQSASGYLDVLMYTLNERERESRLESSETGDVPVMSDLASIGESIAGNAGGYLKSIAYSTDQDRELPFDRAGAFLRSDTADYIREKRMGQIESAAPSFKIGDTNVASFLYQTGLSVAESAALVFAMGPWATGVMALEAAGSATKEALDRGADIAAATEYGTLSGVAEAAFEYISIEHLLKAKDARTFLQQLKSVGVQGLVEGSEEGFTTMFNVLVSSASLGDLSDYGVAVAGYLADGDSQQEAERKASLDTAKGLFWDVIGGVVSGVAMGAMGKPIRSMQNSAEEQMQARADIKDISKDGEALQGLIDSGLESPEETESYKVAERIKAETEGGQAVADEEIEKLYKANKEQIDTENIAQELEKNGVSEKDAGELTPIVKKTLEGRTLSAAEDKQLRANEAADSFVNEAKGYWTEKPAAQTEDVKPEAETVGAQAENTGAQAENTGAQTVSEVRRVESIGKDGAELVLVDGTKVKAADVSLSGAASVLEYADSYDAKGANALYQAYKVYSGSKSGGASAEEYEKSFSLYYNIGLTGGGITYEEAAKMGGIKDPTMKVAYDMGVSAAKGSDEKSLTLAKAQKNTPGRLRSVNDSETSKYQFMQKPDKAKAFTKKQRAAITFLREFSKESGVNIVVYQSAETTGEHGETKREGANGMYDPKTSTLYLDIFAGYNNEQAVLRAASHELTHFMKQWNPEGYRRYQKFLMQQYYGGDSTKVEQMLAAQHGKAQRNGIKLTDAEAMDEVTADASEMLLRDTTVIQRLKKLHHDIFMKIKEFVDKFIKTLQRIAYEGVEAHSEEARYLSETLEDWTEIQGIWDEALKGAAETYKGTLPEAVKRVYEKKGNDAEAVAVAEEKIYNKAKEEAIAHAPEASATNIKEASEDGKSEAQNNERTTGQPDLPGESGGEVLEGVSSKDVQRAGGQGETVRDTEIRRGHAQRDDGGADRQGARPGGGDGAGAGRHLQLQTGEDEGGRGGSGGQLGSERSVLTDSKAKSETALTDEPKGKNFVIGSSLSLPSGEKARYKSNIEAIRLVKQLDAEGRRATPEEQTTLSLYVGWGGIANAFDENKPEWKKEYQELKNLLTDEEYAAARGSTLNAHYTSIDVIKAMYEGLSSLGFEGGRMLEPASGVGNFVGAMPVDMSAKVTSWTMVELDSITGSIAKYLYPNADVRVQGFETARMPDDYYDVAISNVPFGDYQIADKKYPKAVTRAIHNYFFAKTLDKVRPGGIVMFITSRYTMDNSDSSVRKYIADRADLLGAVRLPNTAFKGNAGTSVVTDIIVLKKRAAKTVYSGESFENIEYGHSAGGAYYRANEYFSKHPEMVLGTVSVGHGMYRNNELTYEPLEGSLNKQISKAIKSITGRMDYAAKPKAEIQRAAANASRNTKNGGLEVRGDKVYSNENGTLVEVSADKKKADRVSGLLEIRDAARNLLEQQTAGADSAEARKRLNRLYDKFAGKYGSINSRENVSSVREDPDSAFLRALEKVDKKTGKASKADIFERDTVRKNMIVTHAGSVSDALIDSINARGRVDAGYIAKLTGKAEEETFEELLRSRLVFKDRDGNLVEAAEYLSGNVRAKLKDAEDLADGDPAYKANIEELKKVVPADIEYQDIDIKPGVTWIPAGIYADFIAETLGYSNGGYRPAVKVTYEKSLNRYDIENTSSLKYSAKNTTEWGTNSRSFLDIINIILNNGNSSVSYTDEKGRRYSDDTETLALKKKIEEVTQEFTRWVWKDEERRAKLQRLYNDVMNNTVNREYDGSHLTIDGMAAGVELREHQSAAIQRIISSGGNTLLAHAVGAGKTFEMAGAAMKLRQLGIVKKPMFVVPKPVVGQWGDEFLKFFPAAKILVTEEKDFSAANRRTLTSRIATGDYDAVIVSYEQFKKIPLSYESSKQFYRQQLDELKYAISQGKEDSGGRRTVKDLEKRKKSMEAKMAELEAADSKDADNIDFEQLGVDSLFVDEAHNFKNLMYITNMQRIKGLGNKNGSQRSFDLYMKIRYLQQLNGGKGIVFATATPVMNSMVEMYIMQKYLQSDMLEQRGISTFDAWADEFGSVVNESQMGLNGKMETKQMFSRFKNLPELIQMFHNFSDVKQQQDIKTEIPKMKTGSRITVECDPSEFQFEYMKQLAERANAAKSSGRGDNKSDNMLKIYGDGKKIAYSQKAIDPSLPYEAAGKVAKCAENVARIYNETGEQKGAQIVFCDYGVPTSTDVVTDENATTNETENASGAQIYSEIKRRLVAFGIPAEQVAFAHDAKTDDQKKELYNKVNEGIVRVIIGSTGKIGVGVNMQKRIAAMHHLDAPQRPGDIEQREGRGLRWGNMFSEVGVYTYITKKTFDARLWDDLRRKATFIHQIMSGTFNGREVEGDGDFAVSAAEISALATGNPLILEQHLVNNKILALEAQKSSQRSMAISARVEYDKLSTRIKKARVMNENLRKDMAAKTDVSGDRFSIEIKGRIYGKREAAGDAVIAAAKKLLAERGKNEPGKTAEIGKFAGFTLLVNDNLETLVRGAGTYAAQVNPESALGTIRSLESVVGDSQQKRLAIMRSEAAVEQWKKDLVTLQQTANSTFQSQGELDALYDRRAEIEKELSGGESASEQHSLRDDENSIDNSGDMLHSENRQENGTNGRYAAGEVSAERRSDRGRYRENGSNDSRAKESEVEQAYELSDSDVHYSLREKDPPENTMVGYKVFVAKNGQLYPPMVANPDGAGTPVGVWLDADEGATAKNADGTDKTNTLGRLKVKAGGKGTAGGSGDLAYRPGWHLGEVPLAPQFYETDKITGEKVQHPNFVWAECEFAADVNYQEEAMSYGYTASGKFQHSLAGLPKIPVDGYYTYRTNPNPDTVPWYISGAMKVTKLLGDEETDSILNKMGVVPMKRAGGPIDLAKLGFTQTQFSDRDPEERTNREILADAFESGVARTTAEKTLISDYRGAIKSIDKAENDLREVNAKIKELSFAEGQRDNAKLAELHQKAGKLQSKVTWWDKRLLTLEASAPLKAVLESEKKRVRKEWQQKGRERVEAYRQARNDTKTRQQLRAYIKHSVKRLDNMFRHPTDAAHIPAELRDAIADFMQPFLDEETTDAGNTSVFRAETLRAAREAYESFGEGENELSDVYDEDTAARLAELSKTMDGRRLAELSAVELSELKKVVQHFAHLVSDGNKAFVAGKMESIGNLAEGVISAANERGRKESVKGTDNAFTRMLTTEMMTPSYFFKHIGGNMQTLYNDLLIGGQKTFSEDVQSSRAFLLETADKYHYWQWADTNEKNKNDKLAMTNSIGQKITLTRETALGLYATYMRELSGNDQNAKHLTAGGFVYSEIQENTGGKIARTYQDRTAHPMSAEDMKQVMNWLTAEQKSFANEMVSYLSTTVAGWGNRTSEKLNGYDKFEEPYYYPYKVSTDFLRTNLANMDNRAAMIKNMGMTKSTVRKANAPVDAIPFMQVWTNHVSNMILYDSFALAQDNFMRVFNTKTGVDKDGQTASVSVKAALTEAYGKEAASYILNLMKQICGGITIDPTADVANKLNSWMKKNAVVASASVVVQQPSAIGRAMALVDPKYFAKTITAKRNYEEAVKYSGTAAIKRMGRFDTSTGRNTAKWLMTPPNEKTLAGKARAFMTFGKYDTGYRDDVLSLGAMKADEVTWAHIWNAVKMELQYTTDLEPGSEEFLLAAGRRFDEVINYTQVYDSVLSKSAIMRSEQGLVRMATNFMAEPILSYNMLFDAGAQAKAGNKGYAGRAAAAWALSVALNSLLKSIVTAMRDDDEDKTYIEKYIASLAGNFADDINPLGLIPYVRDALSIFMGYDVERTDMSLISDLYDAMGKMDNENKTMSEKIEIMSGAIAALFGVPLKNVLRDVRSVYNLFFETAPLSETTGEGIRQSVYDALGMEDPAISGAAKLYAAGDIDAYEKAVERLTAGGMDPEEAERRLKKAAGITQSNSVYLDNCIYGYADLNMAVSGGDGDSVKQIVSAMVKAYEGGGKTEKEARAAIRSVLTSEWKPKYLEADSTTRSEIRKALGATGIYASADFDGWIKN